MVADTVIEMDPEMDLEMGDMAEDHAKTIHERDPTTVMVMRRILVNCEGIRYNETGWWVQQSCGGFSSNLPSFLPSSTGVSGSSISSFHPR